MADGWIWLKVRLSTIAAARASMKILGMQLHDEARVEPDKVRRDHLRAEASHYIEKEAELQDAEQRAIRSGGNRE
jgi:hypothetical protein